LKIDFNIKDIYYLNRDEVKFVTLSFYNKITNSSYKTIKELIFSPPTFDIELSLEIIFS